MQNAKTTLKTIITTSALSLALLCGSSYAKGDHAHKPHKEKSHERMIETLDLNENQVDEFKEIMQAKAAIKKEKRQQRKEIRKLLDNGQTNQAAETAATYARQNVLALAEQKQRLETVLTQEQLSTLKEMKKKHPKRNKKHKRPE